MPRVDLSQIPAVESTSYPPPLDAPLRGRLCRRLGPLLGLRDFGLTQVELLPGAISAHRHWHEGEDEVVVVTGGHPTLVDDHGETPLSPGDLLVFPAGDPNAHHLVNRSDAPATFVAIGKPVGSDCHYADVDLHLGFPHPYTHKDGTPY